MHIFRIKRSREILLGKGFYVVDKQGQGASVVDVIEFASRALIANSDLENFVSYMYASGANAEAQAWLSLLKPMFKSAVDDMEKCYVKLHSLGGCGMVGLRGKTVAPQNLSWEDIRKREDRVECEMDLRLARTIDEAEEIAYKQYVEETKRWKLPINSKTFRRKVAALAVALTLGESVRLFGGVMTRRRKHVSNVVRVAGYLPNFGDSKPLKYSTTRNFLVSIV